ncbi:MAG TPA: protein kinase [Anaeromyxobacteraceae bacterium]|nr:protein kinase [Anaeromyxobacteraceae bacterium]
MDGSGEQRQASVATGSVAPGAVTALLQEIARAPEEAQGSAWTQALLPGAVVGRFELVRELGRGGFGVVWEARDRELGRLVAFKAVRAGARAKAREQRLLLEAEAAARLAHPNIVMLYDLGRCEYGPYLVLERLHGETLAERLRRGPLPTGEAVRIATEISKGLAHAHGHGVVHRDLKPANVFLCQDGQVKVLDFGLSQAFGRERTAGGTSGYMAPEQAAGGEEDARTDVYALGATLHEMLAGDRPPAPLPNGLPPSLSRLLGRCLSTEPAGRPKDGQVLLEDLSSAERSLHRPREARRWALRIGLGVVLGAAVAGVVVRRLQPPGLRGPDGRMTVAVADFANETGERDLDSVSGLLITSLEQSEQLRVLTRGRLFDLARQLGRGDAERIDEPLAREVGRKGEARVLLVANLRKLGSSYAVDLRALDPRQDEYLFTASDRALGKEGIFDLVDRLGQTTRRRLGLREVAEAPSPPVASITTGSVKAWDLLSQSRQALDRARGEEAVRLAKEAIEADPGFALAHYQLMVAASWHQDERPAVKEEGRRLVEAAEKVAERLPAKERLSLRAARAWLDGRWEDALRLNDQIAAAHPLDKEAAYHAGDVRFHMESYGEAIPWFQRALQLDPEYLLVRDHLLVAVVRAPHPEAHLEWLRSEAARTEGSMEPHERMRTVARTLLAAGAEKEAVQLFRKATERGGIPWPPPAYAKYLSERGRAVEAEGLLRAALAGLTLEAATEHPDWVKAWKQALLEPLMAQGRVGEFAALAREAHSDQARAAFLEAHGAVAGGSAERLRGALERLRKAGGLDSPEAPLYLYGQAELLLEVGATSEAGRAAEALRRPGTEEPLIPTERRLSDALHGWSTGDLESAEAAARDALTLAPHAQARVFTGLALGLIQRARGNCPGAVATLEAARQERMTSMFSLERPRILHALALCYEQMGDFAKARERIGELLTMWERADPDLPRLAEAKAIRQRLEHK